MDLRAIDILVAEHIFGNIYPLNDWLPHCRIPTFVADQAYCDQWSQMDPHRPRVGDIIEDTLARESCPHYTTDVAEAWKVMETLIPEYLPTLNWVNGWEMGHYDPDKQEFYHLAAEESPALTICLAALRLKGIQIPKDPTD